MKSISLVLPFYNEKAYINITVPAAIKTLEEITSDFEVVLVNDGSSDESPEIALALTGKDKRVRLLSHERNQGLGMAIRTGLAGASKETIIYTDMDMPFDLKVLKDIILYINEFDMVRGVHSGQRESLKRNIYALGYKILIFVFFQQWVKDINFALKIFKKENIGKLNLISTGSFIDAEIFLKHKALGKSIKSVEIVYTPRIYGESHLGNMKNISSTFKEMWRMRKEIISFKRNYFRLNRKKSSLP